MKHTVNNADCERLLERNMSYNCTGGRLQLIDAHEYFPVDVSGAQIQYSRLRGV